MKNGRCQTHEERKRILQRILRVWDRAPELRLGQLLDNANPDLGADIFYIEDEPLALATEALLSNSLVMGSLR